VDNNVVFVLRLLFWGNDKNLASDKWLLKNRKCLEKLYDKENKWIT